MKSLNKMLELVFLLTLSPCLMSSDLVGNLPLMACTNLQVALNSMQRHEQLFAEGAYGQARREFLQQADVFDKALELLATTVDEGLIAAVASEETIEAKLLVLAWDRKQRPEVYKEFESNYVSQRAVLEAFRKKGVPRPQSIDTIHVANEHAGETYRLVWEYYLLRPRNADTRGGLTIRALYAVEDIRDPRSLVTLRRLFAINRYNPRILTNHQQGMQNLLFGAICAFPSEEGLKTLLDCMAMTVGQPRSPENSGREWNVEQAVRQQLMQGNTEPSRIELRNRWREVLRTTSIADLPEKQRRLLEELQVALAEEP